MWDEQHNTLLASVFDCTIKNLVDQKSVNFTP